MIMTIKPFRSRVTFCTLVVVAMGVISSMGGAQEKRAMTLVDLINVPSLTDPQMSPDGKQILYVLAEANWKENRRIRHIWRVNADGTESIQMTNGKDGESAPRWSPDGKRIAFIATRDGTEAEEDDHGQVFLLGNEGGEARPLTRHETPPSSIQWSPDGRFIYFLADDPKTEDEKKRDKAKDDVYAFDENYKQRHLWKISVDSREETRITEGDFSVIGYELSRDGTMIAHHRAPSPLYDDSDESEVWLMSMSGRNAKQLTDNTVSEATTFSIYRGAQLSPDNATVLFTTESSKDFETYYNNNIFLVPATGGPHRMILEDMPYEVTATTWSGDGKSIYFIANTGVRTELFVVDVASETLEQITSGDHSFTGYGFEPELDRHVVTLHDRIHAGEVYVVDGRNGLTLRQVTHVFDDLDERFLIPRQEAVQWKGTDGVTVEGLLYYPLDYEEGQVLPVVRPNPRRTGHVRQVWIRRLAQLHPSPYGQRLGRTQAQLPGKHRLWR